MSAATTKTPTTEAKPPVKLARVRRVCGLDLTGHTTFESLSREKLDGAVAAVLNEFPAWNERQAKKAIRKVLTKRVRNRKKTAGRLAGAGAEEGQGEWEE